MIGWFFLLTLSIFFPRVVNAAYFFVDFRTQNSTWTYLPQDLVRDMPKFTPNGLLMESNNSYFPFMCNNVSKLPSGLDYNFKVRFKYNRVTVSGTGFGLGFLKSIGSYLSQSTVWQDTANKLYFFHQDFS